MVIKNLSLDLKQTAASETSTNCTVFLLPLPNICCGIVLLFSNSSSLRNLVHFCSSHNNYNCQVCWIKILAATTPDPNNRRGSKMQATYETKNLFLILDHSLDFTFTHNSSAFGSYVNPNVLIILWQSLSKSISWVIGTPLPHIESSLL